MTYKDVEMNYYPSDEECKRIALEKLLKDYTIGTDYYLFKDCLIEAGIDTIEKFLSSSVRDFEKVGWLISDDIEFIREMRLKRLVDIQHTIIQNLGLS